MQTVNGENTPGDELPPPAPPADSDRPVGTPILGGVALDLAMRFGLDPLWPRLAFVVLTLILDGFGLLAYLGLWLLLIVGRRRGGWALARLAGAAILVGALFMLQDIDGPWIDSPWGLAALLAGAAVALWAPRGIPAPAGPVIDHARTDDRAGAPAPAAAGPDDGDGSVLGRATLGVAFVAGAVGALIDQVNGGRLHPEQWLGAAAAVCGLGMVVGAWRGRGTWLIVPALAFAGAGFIAGHAARAGVDSLSLDDEQVWIDADTIGPVNSTRTAGAARLTVLDAPRDGPVSSDLRVGIGDVEIDVDDAVTVEIRTGVHDGEVRLDGQRRDAGTITLGPEGEPDVVVHAEVSLGDIDIERFDLMSDGAIDIAEPSDVPPLPTIPVEPAFDLGEGVQMASDGTVLLPEGAGAIGPDGEIWSPYEWAPRADGVTVISTPFGEYQVLPNQMVITPGGTLIDVPAHREELLASETSAPPTTAQRGG